MRTIINKAHRPLRIPLPGGKTLHLGLAGRGQVPNDALQRPALRKLIEAGEIKLLGDEDRSQADDRESTKVHESTHGHTTQRSLPHKGER